MLLSHYQNALLKILKQHPASAPSKIDRLFYQLRIDEGISIEKIYDISCTQLLNSLAQAELIDRGTNKITALGEAYLAQSPR